MTPTMAKWLADAQSGDLEARGKLLEHVRAVIQRDYRVRRLRRRVSPQWSDSDVAQAACLKVVTNLEDLRGKTPEQFVKWVVEIARNEVIDVLRREQVEQSILDSGRHSESASGVDDSDAAEETAAVRGGMARLPARMRRVLRLHYWKGLPYARIAEGMGLSVHAVQQIAWRARAKLRRWL